VNGSDHRRATAPINRSFLMAKEISSSNSSLSLHEVLEAEFKALHGELPPNYPTSGEGEVGLKELREGMSQASGSFRIAIQRKTDLHYTMEKLCTDCGGDFRCFIGDIVKSHLKIEPPDWLARSLEPLVRPQAVW
jgi:hypothetical protein